MSKLKGFREFCENSGLTYEEGILRLQKIVPTALLDFSGKEIVIDYNILGICWQVYRTTLETIGFPETRTELYAKGLEEAEQVGILDTAIHNSEIECRLLYLYNKLAKEGKTLSLHATCEDAIRTYYVFDSNNDVDLNYPIHKYINQKVVVFN